MDKWLLLAATSSAVYGLLDAVGWQKRTQRLPAQETEKVVGYDASNLSPPEREYRANFARSFALNKVIVILVGITLALASATFRAFFP